eukprot:gene17361-biopygen18873
MVGRLGIAETVDFAHGEPVLASAASPPPSVLPLPTPHPPLACDPPSSRRCRGWRATRCTMSAHRRSPCDPAGGWGRGKRAVAIFPDALARNIPCNPPRSRIRNRMPWRAYVWPGYYRQSADVVPWGIVLYRLQRQRHAVWRPAVCAIDRTWCFRGAVINCCAMTRPGRKYQTACCSSAIAG